MVAIILQSIATRYAQHGRLAIMPYALRHQQEAFGTIL